MKQLGARMAKDSFAYGGLSILQSGISVLLLPLYLEKLRESYGVLDLANQAIFFLEIFVLLQIPAAMMRWCLLVSSDDSDRRAILGTSIKIVLVSNALICLALALLPNITIRIVFADGDSVEPYKKLLWVMIGNVFLTALFQMRIQYLRMTNNLRKYAVQNIVLFVTTVISQFVLILVFDWGAFGAMLGAFISLVAVTILMLPWLMECIAMPFSRRHAAAMLKFGLPMVPGLVASWVLNSSNRFFLKEYHGTAAVSILATASRIALILTLCSNAIVMAWGPLRYEIGKRVEARRLLAQTTTYVSAGLLALALLAAIFAGDLLHVIAPPIFFEAAPSAQLLVFAMLMLALHQFFGVGIFLSGKTSWHGISYAVGAGLSILLNFLLIPRWGVEGAALALLLSHGACLVMQWYASQIFYPIPFEYGRLIKMSLAAGLVMLVAQALPTATEMPWVYARMGLMIVYVLILFVSGFCHKSELAFARSKLRNRLW